MSVRFGFVGAGWIAHRALAPAVHAAEGAVLQAVAARDASRAARLEPAGRCYDDYAALLDDPAVDVVYLSLSNEAHVPWAVRALEAGKHVLCEKPLGLDAAEVDRAFAAAAAADRLLVEALWYRWHPRSTRSQALVAAGDLGEIRHVDAELAFVGDWSGENAGNYRLDPTRGGGAWYDVGVYPLSFAEWALAAEGFTASHPVTVAEAQGTWDGGVDLRMSTRLRTATGATADLRCGISGPAGDSAAITGTTASLSWDEGAFMTWKQPCDLRIRSGAAEPVVERFAATDPYQLMVEAVAARIRGEDAFVVSPATSRTIATVSDQVRAAARPPGPDDTWRRP